MQRAFNILVMLIGICLFLQTSAQYTKTFEAWPQTCRDGGSSWIEPLAAKNRTGLAARVTGMSFSDTSSTLECTSWQYVPQNPIRPIIMSVRVSYTGSLNLFGVTQFLTCPTATFPFTLLAPDPASPFSGSTGYRISDPFPDMETTNNLLGCATTLFVTASVYPSASVNNFTLVVQIRTNECSTAPECTSGSGCFTRGCTCDRDDGWIPKPPSTCDGQCGDARVRGTEECDFASFGCAGCKCNRTLGMYPAEPVGLNCVSQCGDGIVAAPAGEQCDTRIPFYPNYCMPDCRCNTTAGYQYINGSCRAVCGDGIIAGPEDCEGGRNCTTCRCDAGTVAFNGTCVSCPIGTYINANTNGTCVRCPTGTRQDLPAASQCVLLYTCQSSSTCSIGCSAGAGCQAVVNGTVNFDSSAVTTVLVRGQVTVVGSFTSNSGVDVTLSPGATLTVSNCLNVPGDLLVDLGSMFPSNGTILATFSDSCSTIGNISLLDGQNQVCTQGRFSVARQAAATAGRANLVVIFTPPETILECSSQAVEQQNSLNLPGIIAGAVVGALVIVAIVVVISVRPIRERVFPYRKREAQVNQQRLTTMQE